MSVTKKQIEEAFLQYVNDHQKSSASDVHAFALCLNCGYPLYVSPASVRGGYAPTVFHLGWQGFCFEPKWRKR